MRKGMQQNGKPPVNTCFRNTRQVQGDAGNTEYFSSIGHLWKGNYFLESKANAKATTNTRAPSECWKAATSERCSIRQQHTAAHLVPSPEQSSISCQTRGHRTKLQLPEHTAASHSCRITSEIKSFSSM